jgi:hippurate hydrolase
VTVGSFRGGSAGNVIPQTAELRGTVRSFEPEVRDLLQRRVTEIAQGIAASYGAVATVDYKRLYPPTVNHPKETAFAVSVAQAVAGEDNVDADKTPLMGSEDFSFMLEERAGNIMLIGNGDTASCHDRAYDFNDAAIPHGVSYWVRLIETAMPA